MRADQGSIEVVEPLALLGHGDASNTYQAARSSALQPCLTVAATGPTPSFAQGGQALLAKVMCVQQCCKNSSQMCMSSAQGKPGGLDGADHVLVCDLCMIPDLEPPSHALHMLLAGPLAGTPQCRHFRPLVWL